MFFSKIGLVAPVEQEIKLVSPYGVAKFRMIILYIEISDVIHANEHTKHVNCGLHENVLLISFCFMMKRDYLKQKLLIWRQVPSNGFLRC